MVTSFLKLLLLFGVLAAAVVVAVFFLPSSHPEAGSSETAQASRPPNILLISLDTTRPDHLGCYGYQRKTSPNLDDIARQGVRFRQARCLAPLTLPSHMALFTSMLPSHNTVDHLEAVLPSGVPTLAQLLQAHGYTTAAIVNDAQMQARWGFNRGFDLWREFHDGRPQGNCEHLTTEALDWLGTPPAEPFCLFLHYYDPHANYEPPAKYREAFGCTLNPAQTQRLLLARRPEQTGPSPAILQQIVGAYDGEIAWMDTELGRLFSRLPKNTLVVVFSDHGEPFKEHGWMAHGATLYEEDIRTALFMRHPTLLPEGLIVDEPVTLLDVMPTVLNLCGIQPPPQCEGSDLSPLWQERPLPDRYSLAENKASFDWCVQKMAKLREWKLIYSLFDGKRELYKLPDEHTERSHQDPVMAQTLFSVIRGWMEQEDYWMLYAHGKGDFSVTLTPREGQCTHLLQVSEFDTNRIKDVKPMPNNRSVEWTFSQHSGTRGLYFQIAPPTSPLKADFRIDGKHVADKIFLGPERTHPQVIPWKSGPADPVASPVIMARFQPAEDGFYLTHHRGKEGNAISAVAVPLDDKTIEQLRSLGYLR